MKQDTEKLIATLTRDGRRLDRYVLIANDETGCSIFYAPVEGGLSILHIENDEEEKAHVALLKEIGALEYSSIDAFIQAHKNITPAKAIPIKQ